MNRIESTGLSRRGLLAGAAVAVRPILAKVAAPKTEFASLKQIDAGVLRVGYAEAVPVTAAL